MNSTIVALFPVFALLMLGNLLRRTDFLNESFWSQAEKLTYYVLFPALLINKLGHAAINMETAGDLLVVIPLYLVAGTLVTFLIKPLLKTDNPGFTSIYQANIRFNSYVGLAVVAILLPAEALAIAAIVLAIMIPIVNLLCILVFSLFTEQKKSMTSVLLSTLKNPLIVGCLIGIFISVAGIQLPKIITQTLHHIGAMALPMGLLAVGAGLHFKVLKSSGIELIVTSIIKLGIMPVIAYALGKAWGMESLTLSVLLIIATLPTASSAYILAKQLGGDAKMMSALITGQTLIAFATIPLMLKLLN